MAMANVLRDGGLASTRSDAETNPKALTDHRASWRLRWLGFDDGI